MAVPEQALPDQCPHSTVHRDPLGCSQCLGAKPKTMTRGADGLLYEDGVLSKRAFVAPGFRPRNVKKRRPDPADIDT